MHILFLSDHFPPESNAPATRLVEHARLWVNAGHRVTVITSAPNAPEGKLFAGYKNRWYAREKVDGIDVVRVKTFIASNEGFALRILDYLSFMVSSAVAGLFQERPDVIVATSPQLFCAVGGWALSAVRRRPFVFELRDLWPESIRGVGVMRDTFLIRVLEKLELFLYRRAHTIVAVTEAFRDNLVRRGIAGAKIAVVRNGVDLASYTPRPRDPELARNFAVEGKFVVGYLGTHGMAHALTRVLEAADRLRDRNDIRFVFVGAGATRRELIEEARAMQLPNVLFFPLQPKSDMPAIWSLCDVALIHLKDAPVFSTVIPSKIFEAMGMGVPLLFAGPDGEAAEIVRSTRSGVTVGAEQPAELAEAVRRLADSRAELREFAINSRDAAHAFDRAELARRMLAILERTCGAPREDALREQAVRP